MHSLKSETARIPKIIWQTAKDPNNLHINATLLARLDALETLINKGTV